VRHVRCADGSEAIADDMPPYVRAFALLLEHANARRDQGLALPCPCRECERHRGAVRCTKGPDGAVIIEPA
jgi:hypothetical protein